nr:hypothetical protein Itr_chr02CG16790 [Ipomoea trifida]
MAGGVDNVSAKWILHKNPGVDVEVTGVALDGRRRLEDKKGKMRAINGGRAVFTGLTWGS